MAAIMAREKIQEMKDDLKAKHDQQIEKEEEEKRRRIK